MSTIASHSPLNISETVSDRGLVPCVFGRHFGGRAYEFRDLHYEAPPRPRFRSRGTKFHGDRRSLGEINEI